MPKFFVRNTADAAICERWLVTADSADQAIAIAQGDEEGECEFVAHFDIDFENNRDDYEAEEITDEEAGEHVRRERIESAAPAMLAALTVAADALTPPNNSEEAEALALINAAIASATGGEG